MIDKPIVQFYAEVKKKSFYNGIKMVIDVSAFNKKSIRCEEIIPIEMLLNHSIFDVIFDRYVEDVKFKIKEELNKI